jgi:muramoyltetrapeptide carboxypeptidase
MMIKPQSLSKGDEIAIISPSAGLAGMFPHRIEKAKKFLESIGFKVNIMPHAKTVLDWSAGTPEERVNDLHNAFEDEKIKAIICSIGGNVSNQLLPLIDFDIIRENPKIFCGYSDITILHCSFFTKSNIVTFYGPSAMNQFGEYPKPLEYTVKYFLKSVSNTQPLGKIEPSNEWTDELLDWSKKEDTERPRKMKKNDGFKWLNSGHAKGQIIGGCLPSLLQLKGTDYWPDYKNKILLIELPEGQEFGAGYPLESVDSDLTDLEILGIFNDIKGLIVGRPYRYSKEDEDKLKNLIKKHCENFNFPILYGFDSGHSDPMVTIPLGTEIIIDSSSGIRFLESGVI